MRALRTFAVALFALVATALPPGEAGGAADPEAARAVAEKLVDGAHGALAGTPRPEAERLAELRRTIDEAFAFDVWEKFLLGEKASSLSTDQIAEFRSLLPGFLADLYRKQFGKGLEAKPEILEVRRARNDMLVRAAIPRANGRTLPVDWRIRDFGERGHLVIDVMVGGASFLILKRDEFSSILEKDGPGALLDFMRKNSV